MTAHKIKLIEESNLEECRIRYQKREQEIRDILDETYLKKCKTFGEGAIINNVFKEIYGRDIKNERITNKSKI